MVIISVLMQLKLKKNAKDLEKPLKHFNKNFFNKNSKDIW